MDSLPTEILSRIVSYLYTSDAYNLTRVNRRFREVALPVAWRALNIECDNRWHPNDPPRFSASLNDDVKLDEEVLLSGKIDHLLGYVRELTISEFAKPLPVIGPKKEHYGRLKELQPLLNSIDRVHIVRNLMGRACSYKTMTEQFVLNAPTTIESTQTVYSIGQIPDGYIYDHITKLDTQDMPLQRPLPSGLRELTFVYTPDSDGHLERELRRLPLETLHVKSKDLRNLKWVPERVRNLTVEVVNENEELQIDDDGDQFVLSNVVDLTLIARSKTAKGLNNVNAPYVRNLSLVFDSLLESTTDLETAISRSPRAESVELYCSPQRAQFLALQNLKSVLFAHVDDTSISDAKSIIQAHAGSLQQLVLLDECWTPAISAAIEDLPIALGIKVSDPIHWRWFPLDSKFTALDNDSNIALLNSLEYIEDVTPALEEAKIDHNAAPARPIPVGMYISMALMTTIVVMFSVVPDFYPDFYDRAYGILPEPVQHGVDWWVDVRSRFRIFAEGMQRYVESKF